MSTPSPTRTLQERASELSLSSSSTSSDFCKKHPNSQECQKPTTGSGLEIGLGVGIPVFLVILVLGFFFFRNYRKNKREDMEHDPDFDENGEATILPDFPPMSKEDPFDNRHSIRDPGRYSGMHHQNRSAQDLRSMLTRGGMDDYYMGGFVLPYQHQTGSKATLDEYARQVDSSRRRDSVSSSGTASYLPSNNPAPISNRYSPQKNSNLRYHVESPVKQPSAKEVMTQYHGSLTLVDDPYGTKQGTSSGTTSTSSNNQFGINYENELNLAINLSLPNRNLSVKEPLESRSRPTEVPYPDGHNLGQTGEQTAESPFEDNFQDSYTTPDVSHSTTNDSATHLQPETQNTSKVTRSPRMLAFNMLKNVSDDEDGPDIPEHLEEFVAENAEEAEKLARLKSVYKVYFDRSGSVKSNAGSEPGDQSFQADFKQPLPALDTNVKINRELRADTNLEKRGSTASSLYDDTHEGHSYQQVGNGRLPPSMRNPDRSASGDDNDSFVLQEMAPLKSLPHASDIRNSTIETFTDYERRAKITSPLMRSAQQGYFDSDLLGLPQMSISPSLPTPVGEVPSIRSGRSKNGQVPSASQLARTSVVMLNSVDEISGKKSYKPAGSIPRAAVLPSLNHGGQHSPSADDLIPGNRKSDVRRMMNTTF